MKRLMILSGMLLLIALLASGCGAGSQAAGESPLEVISESSTATLTPDERAKIDPELLAVIEWEEAHPGKGQEVAPDDFWFSPEKRISCIVFFDRDKIVVTPTSIQGLPLGEQPAGKLVVHHGGQVTSELEGNNSVGCFIPLDKIKGLAREEVVTRITPNRIISTINE